MMSDEKRALTSQSFTRTPAQSPYAHPQKTWQILKWYIIISTFIDILFLLTIFI